MKAKTIFLMLFAALIQINFCQAQSILSKVYGGTQREKAIDIQPTTDGGFIVCGHTASNDFDVHGNHGNTDFWVVKLNASLDTQWTRAYGGNMDEQAISIKEVTTGTDKGYIIVGSTTSNYSGDVGKNYGDADIWIVRLKPNGDTLWTKTIGGLAGDWGGNIITTTDGGFLICGTVKGNIYINGTLTNSFHGGYDPDYGIPDDAVVIKLFSNGVIDWAKILGGSNFDYASSIIETSDGYIMAGSSYSIDGDLSGQPHFGDVDMWVVKLNNLTGDTIWTKTLGGSAGDWADYIQKSSDGSFIILGITSSTDFCTSFNPLHTSNDFDYCLVNLSKDGTKVNWKYNYGGSGDDIGYVVKQMNDSGYLMSGVSASNDGNVSGNHLSLSGTPSYDYWLLKVFSNGVIDWQKTFGGSGDDFGAGYLIPDDGIIMAGFSNSTDGDLAAQPHYGDFDYWVVKYYRNYNAVEINCPANISRSVLRNCQRSINTPNPVITLHNNTTLTQLTWAMTGATTGSSRNMGINYVGTRNFNVGVTTITYTATNSAGFVATCSFTVTVIDDILPTINCPANVSGNAGRNSCSLFIRVPNPAINDNCSVSSLTWIMTGATTDNSPATGINYVGRHSFNVGLTIITYTAKDASGNMASCSFTVRVRGSINCNPNAMIANDVINKIGAEAISWDDVKIYPNPTNQFFTLETKLLTNEKIGLQIFDTDGKLVEQLTSISKIPLQFGASLHQGLYLVKVIMGKDIKTIKVIKQ